MNFSSIISIFWQKILPLGALVPIVWILGGPGCGKSTQCRNVLQKYGFDHMSTGELLRDEVATGSEKGKKWQEMMNRGQLIPLNEVMEVLKNAMASVNVTTKGYLIDGCVVTSFSRKKPLL